MASPQQSDTEPDSMGRQAKRFGSQLYAHWSREKPSRLAAALAYYGIFSFAPVLFVVITVASLFLEELITPLLGQIYTRIEASLGPEMADFVRELVLQAFARTTENSTLASLIGLGALFYAASALFAHLKYSLNVIWAVTPEAQGGPLRFVLNRLLAFVLVIGLGLLLVVAVVATLAISILQSWLEWNPYLPVANTLIVFLLTTLTFGVIYKILPDTRIAWRDLWIGAPVTAGLVLLGGWVVVRYLANFNVGSAFQAAGSLAVMLIGFYYVAQIFLAGAIFTRVYAEQLGSRATREAINQ